MRCKAREMVLAPKLYDLENRRAAIWRRCRRVSMDTLMKPVHIFMLIALLILFVGCGVQAPNKITEQVAPAKEDAVWNADWHLIGRKVGEWQKAAEEGDAEAQYNLGSMYTIGDDVPMNPAKAVEWYKKAAEQGHSDAQYNLGRAFVEGEGTPKDAAKAVEWWEKAAEQGHAYAQYNLGWVYAKGEGVPKDAAKAVEWWEKAAAKGLSYAQYNLGWAYFTGEGVPKDLVLAYAWSNLGAVKGGDTAKKIRNLVESELTSTERAEGQRLTTNWKPRTLLTRENASLRGSSSRQGKGKGYAPRKRITGTGFVTSNSGHILTNYHVIKSYNEIRISGREGVVKLLVADIINDLAVLQISEETKDFATLASASYKLRQGEDIVVYGYPLNAVLSSGGNLSSGVVSALTGLGNNTNQIQITAPIQPGSSGSPVINKKGHVVGVVSIKLSDAKIAKATGSVPQNVSFAINAHTVRSFLDAHEIPYKTGSGFFDRKKSSADIAEEARKWTVIVEGWK